MSFEIYSNYKKDLKTEKGEATHQKSLHLISVPLNTPMDLTTPSTGSCVFLTRVNLTEVVNMNKQFDEHKEVS